MKTYLLDTNVFIANPLCVSEFSDNGQNCVCLYAGVLQELDNLKNHPEKGYYARRALEALEIETSNKNILFIDFIEDTTNSVDDDLIKIAEELGYILVTQDRTVRIKANLAEIKVEDYERVKTPALPENNFWEYDNVTDKLYYNNVQVKIPNEIFGVKPKDWRQGAALNILLDSTTPLVAIVGQAGTGKNLLALAAGLELILQECYDKIYVTRLPVPNAYDIGYLPGNIDEKLMPWLSGVYDNLEFLFGYGDTIYTEEFKKSRIKILSASHIKGASINKGFIIIDESQDIHPNDIKMLITRAGLNTKIVLLGDINQINTPYLNKHYNGLSYVINKLHGQKLFKWIELQNIQRSSIAELAAKLL